MSIWSWKSRFGSGPHRSLAGIGKTVLGILVITAGLGLFFLALTRVGQWTRAALRSSSRYTVSFADIDCAPPPGQERGDFLAEVRYLAEVPEPLHLLDEDLTRQLAQAFARHPRVQQVEQVEVAPPRQVRVRLRYRTPALVVQGTAEVEPGSLVRVVDSEGILLPASAHLPELPVLVSRSCPSGPAGTPWGDAEVEGAARTAGLLQPYQERLRITRYTLAADGLHLRTAMGISVLWGRPPGVEEAGEAPAAQKLQRLLSYLPPSGPLGKLSEMAEYDLRSPADTSR